MKEGLDVVECYTRDLPYSKYELVLEAMKKGL
jgi:hypothetical protein